MFCAAPEVVGFFFSFFFLFYFRYMFENITLVCVEAICFFSGTLQIWSIAEDLFSRLNSSTRVNICIFLQPSYLIVKTIMLQP